MAAVKIERVISGNDVRYSVGEIVVFTYAYTGKESILLIEEAVLKSADRAFARAMESALNPGTPDPYHVAGPEPTTEGR